MAMEKYILQAPNCWHQFSGRAVGVGVPRRTVVLQSARPLNNRDDPRKVSAGAGGAQQGLEVMGGEEEKATGSII
jgi:1-phosphatidylinositol-3-phosphate 5-kinase